MGKKDDKTNVMRVLDQKHVDYRHYAFETGDTAPSGVEVADILGIDVARVYKTLVTVGKSGEHYVFIVPVAKELNLKYAASAVGEKNIEMIKSKDLLPLTGYVHGGCSPIGMKKFFKTTFDESITGHETILFSAGKIGRQVEIKPGDIEKIIRIQKAKLCD